MSSHPYTTLQKAAAINRDRDQRRTTAALPPLHLPMVADALKVIDFALIFALGWIAFRICRDMVHLPLPRFWPEYGLLTLAGTLIAAKALGLTGIYDGDSTRPVVRQAARIAVALFSVAVLLAILHVLTDEASHFSPAWSVSWLSSAFVAVTAAHAVAAVAVRLRVATGSLTQNVVVVGAGEYGQRLIDQLAAARQPGVRILGLFDDRRHRVPRSVGGFSVLGTTEDLLELGKTTAIDQIIIALPWSAEARLVELMHRLKPLPANISLCPDRIGFHLHFPGVTRCGTVPLVSVVDPPLRHWRGVAKACEDRVLAVGILVLISPLLAAIALAIRLESPGPILFRQKRHGFNNQVIEVFKFRTMYHGRGDDTGANQTQRGDPRVTRVGAFLRRTSLDELPQFFNVLKGDMSVVGPRPHPIGMRTEQRLCHEIVADYAHRHRMKPGITGWAQVNGWRGATDSAEKLQRRVEHDLYYIENWSLTFDLRILFLTVVRLFADDNAF